MSKGVQDRIQLSRTVILAGYLYADVVAEAWKRHLHEFRHHLLLKKEWQRLEQWLAALRPADGPSLSLGDLFRFIAGEIEELGEAMVAGDETLTRCRAELRRKRRRRERLAKKVYRELSRTRTFFSGILGYQEGCDYLDLKGPTPRDPYALRSWARRAAGVLADAEKSPARDYAKGGKLKTSELAERLAERCAALHQAIHAVFMAEEAESAALEAQREAIAAFDRKHKPGARVFEAALDFFGLPSLAETVRPGVKRRGRPCKQRLVDVYPDLVARMLGEEHLERRLHGRLERDGHPAAAGTRPSLEDRVAAGAATAANGDDSNAGTAGPGTEARQGKIAKGSRKLKQCDPKIEPGSRKLSNGERKIEKDSRKLRMAGPKIETPLRKSAKRDSSLAFVILTPRLRSRPRRRIVHGLDSLHRRRRPLSSDPVPVEPGRLRRAASTWWQRLKRSASGSI